MSFHYVYILSSLNKKRSYVGQTDNLEKRLCEHNRGKVTSTKPFVPYVVIHFERFETRIEALAREKFLKTGLGREELKKIFETKNIKFNWE